MLRGARMNHVAAMAGVVVAAAALVAPRASHACLMPDLALDPQYRAFGQQYLVGGSALANTGGGAMAFRIGASGLNGVRNTSAAFLWNDAGGNGSWAISAYHNWADFNGFTGVWGELSTGPNFNTNRGMVLQVSAVYPMPPGAYRDPNQPDLILIHLAQSLQGAQPAVLGTVGVGEIVTHAGFGRYGDPNVGILPQDGNVRACQAPVNDGVTYEWTAAFYQESIWHSYEQSYPRGRIVEYYSGSPVFSASGRLVGVGEYGTNGSFPSGVSGFEKLMPDTITWIHSIAGYPATCETPAVSQQPASTSTCPAGTASFSVTATGTAPTYQWRVQNPATSPPTWADLADGPLVIGGVTWGTIAGATTGTLHASPDPLVYYTNPVLRVECVVSNACGSVTSNPATLRICPADFNCSGALAVADIFAFLNAWFAADPRTDFDGVNGLQIADIFAFLNAWFAGC